LSFGLSIVQIVAGEEQQQKLHNDSDSSLFGNVFVICWSETSSAGAKVNSKHCSLSLQICYLQEYPLERYIRDTRLHQILGGTLEIMRLIVSRRLLSMADPEAIL
jgi:alkylation response protein AidB-like acyl-CoA dehydrogenase